MNFQQYKQQKDKTEFESGFTHLCEKIFVNGSSFEDWWIKSGIPVMAESYKFNSPEQLLNEAGWWNGLKNVMGYGGQQQPQRPSQWQKDGNQYNRTHANGDREVWNPRAKNVNYNAQDGTQTETPVGAVPPGYKPPQDVGGQPSASSHPMPQRPMGSPAQPQMSPEQQQKIAQYQQRADQEIGVIKKKFAVAMKDFVKSVTDEAKQSGDHHSWQIARKFCDKITQATQPVVQSFAMKAASGKADYKDQYTQERDAMQGGQQAGAQDELKNKYSQGKPLQDLMNRRLQQSTGMNMGPNGQIPQGVQDTQAKLASGQDPLDPANFQAPQAAAPTPTSAKLPRRRGRKGVPTVSPATGTNGMSFESVQDDMFIKSLTKQSKKTTNFSIMGF